MKIGDKLPDFNATATNLPSLSATDLLGRYTVLYFYPKDNTPGCTNEGLDFAEHYAEFQKMNAEIYGISKDSLKKHENFKAKYDFPFELISDPDETLCKIFDVIKLKKNYGREYLGIERSTFLLNPENELIHEWRKVRVKDHVNEVMTTLQSLQNN
ncbi:MAG: peroxiredoxin [Hydrogenovibrio sp.]|nr:peroxiredoxin [Hydrogenovibrio sp.]